MHWSFVLGALPIVSAGFAAFVDTRLNTFSNTSDPSTACAILKQRYGNLTVLPADAGYTDENEVSWSREAWLGPACIFVPRNAEELSFAVKTLVDSSTLFAMRGGGHMPIADAANINSTGVQISSTNLNTLKLSDDKQTISIGSGPRWGDVYEYLDGTNLTVVGGRLPPVGVPGLLLGGGVSYYSNAHGLASAGGKVKAYECVLADGTIATVAANNSYSDLYWALQGGGNSFALVTRFDLQTIYAETPLRAEATYEDSATTKDAYLDALLDFTLRGDEDTAASVIPLATWAPNFTTPSYGSTLFYNGSSAPTAGAFANLYNESTLKSVNQSSTMHPLSLANYSRLLSPAFEKGGPVWGFRQKFHAVSITASREAMDIVHDTWFLAMNSSNIANRVPGFLSGLAYNSVTRTLAEKSAGTPQNIDPTPQFWVEESILWSNADDDAEIEALTTEINDKIATLLEEKGLAARYVYLNDAELSQKVFESYGTESVKRLKATREKYDPSRVFTDLMPGGFKVEKAGQ